MGRHIPKRLQVDSEAIGRLSNPSKMPCFGYSIPAHYCQVGGRLRLVPESGCSHCYALKGRYVMQNVMDAMERRYQKVQQALADTLAAESFVTSFAKLLNETGQTHFRWHDSGDLQSLAHLELIVRICDATPTVQHWLPTREYKIVCDYLDAYGAFPPNLTVRVSAHMIGGKAVKLRDLPSSGIHPKLDCPAEGVACPAYENDGHCGDCRMCWDREVAHVSYPLH